MKKTTKVVNALWVLFALLFAVLLTACPDGAGEKVTLTLVGDSQITIDPDKVVIDKGKLWSEVKEEVEKSLRFASGYQLKEWRLENEAGGVVPKEWVFNADKTLYAQSKRSHLVLSIDCGSGLIPMDPTVEVAKGSTWAEVKALVNAAIYILDDYAIESWHLDNETGTVLTDEMVFNENKTLYATSIKTRVLLTLQGDSNVIVTTSSLKVDRNSTWAAIQAQVNAAISFAPTLFW